MRTQSSNHWLSTLQFSPAQLLFSCRYVRRRRRRHQLHPIPDDIQGVSASSSPYTPSAVGPSQRSFDMMLVHVRLLTETMEDVERKFEGIYAIPTTLDEFRQEWRQEVAGIHGEITTLLNLVRSVASVVLSPATDMSPPPPFKWGDSSSWRHPSRSAAHLCGVHCLPHPHPIDPARLPSSSTTSSPFSPTPSVCRPQISPRDGRLPELLPPSSHDAWSVLHPIRYHHSPDID